MSPCASHQFYPESVLAILGMRSVSQQSQALAVAGFSSAKLWSDGALDGAASRGVTGDLAGISMSFGEPTSPQQRHWLLASNHGFSAQRA